MEKSKENKGYVPGENKAMVRIRFKPGRMGEGAVEQADGTHLANEKDAAYWVSIGYAEYVNGKGE